MTLAKGQEDLKALLEKAKKKKRPGVATMGRRFWSLPADFMKRKLSTLTSHQRGCAMSFYIKNFVIFCPWGIYVITNFFLI